MAKCSLADKPTLDKSFVPTIGKRKRAVIWIGPPLCGKDTQTERYERLGIPVMKMGPLLKAIAQSESADLVKTDISTGKLADDSIAIWEAKKWIMRHITAPVLHLNGVPRTVSQLSIVKFLIEHGFDPIAVWFATTTETCLARPIRPDRELEDTPQNRKIRIAEYVLKTLPMLPVLPEFGISTEKGNLVIVDNSKTEKHETGAIIANHLKLPDITPDLLFPEVSGGWFAVNRVLNGIPAKP